MKKGKLSILLVCCIGLLLQVALVSALQSGGIILIEGEGGRVKYFNPDQNFMWKSPHIDSPRAVAFDWKHNAVWVAEKEGVTKLDEFGQVMLTVGLSEDHDEQVAFSYPGDIVVDKEGNVWVADPSLGAVIKLSQEGEELLRLTNIVYPQVLTYDSGEHAIIIGAKNTIQKVDSEGNELFELSGFDHPAEIVLDKSGYIWVADKENRALVKVSPVGLEELRITQGVSEGLRRIVSATVDSENNVWIVDKDNRRLTQFTRSGTPTASVVRSKLGQPSKIVNNKQTAEVFITNRNELYKINAAQDLELVTELVYDITDVLIVQKSSTTPTKRVYAEQIKASEETVAPEDNIKEEGKEKQETTPEQPQQPKGTFETLQQQVQMQELRILDLQKESEQDKKRIKELEESMKAASNTIPHEKWVVGGALVCILGLLLLVVHLVVKRSHRRDYY